MTEKLKPAIEEHSGVFFEVPVWDPTPVPWNEQGSWAKDEGLSELVLVGIKQWLAANGLVEKALVKEAMKAKFERRAQGAPLSCGVFWGSHGCDRIAGHKGLHVCNGCSALYKLSEYENEWGKNCGDAILWFSNFDEKGKDTFLLSSLYWTWFNV